MESNVPDVLQFCPSLTAPQALQLLQENNGDVNNAVNQFYERGAPSAPSADSNKYNEALFSSDRDGYNDGSVSRAFQIDGGVVGDYDVRSGAPTRPPSRTSHHSADSGVNMPNIAMKSVEGQESGVIGSSGAVFGPANRDVYDTDKWAMALVGTQERVPDVAAIQRQREEAGPAFLKPLPSGDYLPSLITMLYNIPWIRNLLLCPQYAAADYGRGEDWWKGTPIDPPAVIEVDDEPSYTVYLEMVHEVQRLMAFLDRTDRAYGSVEPLCNLEAFINAVSEEPQATNLSKFMLGWERAIDISNLGHSLRNPLHSEVNVAGKSEQSHYLDATVIPSVPGERISLYDVLDSHMFPNTGYAFVTNISNVLIIKLSQSDSNARKLDVEIPAIFYADRYMESNAPQLTKMLRDARQYEDQITEINSKINKVKYHHSKKTGKSVESLKLLKSSIKAFESWDGEEVQDGNANSTLQKLQKIYSNIEVKIQELDEQKRKVRQILDEITGIFKPPTEEPKPTTNGETQDTMETSRPANPFREVPTLKYMLCGVATEPNIMYFRSAITNSEDKRWWRIQYQYTYDSPLILREQVAEDFVLTKASDEHSEALLVYANEHAIHASLNELPKSLLDFVEHDNYQFKEELKNASKKPDWDTTITPPHKGVDWDADFTKWGGPPPSDGHMHSNDNDDAFADMTARQWLDNQNQSSNTITPNSEMTETGGEVREIEMKEVQHIEVLPKDDESAWRAK